MVISVKKWRRDVPKDEPFFKITESIDAQVHKAMKDSLLNGYGFLRVKVTQLKQEVIVEHVPTKDLLKEVERLRLCGYIE